MQELQHHSHAYCVSLDECAVLKDKQIVEILQLEHSIFNTF